MWQRICSLIWSDLEALNYSIFNGKEIIDSSWHNMAIGAYKISLFNTSNQILIWDNIVNDHVFDTLEHFVKLYSDEYNELVVPNWAGQSRNEKKKRWGQAFKIPIQAPYTWYKSSYIYSKRNTYII